MKIAIVGCGQIADAHIEEARRIPGTKVVAVCDMNIHMARQAAVRYGIEGCFTNLDDMMKETGPDVVHITTPPFSHLQIGLTALKYGAHIYMEKPFTVRLDEAEELVDTANKAGKLICVGHNSAFDPSFLRLKESYLKGELGDIVHMDTIMGYGLGGPFGAIFMGDPEHWLHRLPGGLFQNNISHPLSFIVSLISDKDIKVSAFGYRFRPETFGDIRDQFFDELRVQFAAPKKTAHLIFSCQASPIQMGVTVYGTKCAATSSMNSRTLRFTKGGSLPGVFSKVELARNDLREARREFYNNVSKVLLAKMHFFEGMKELFSQFFGAINGKNEMPIPMDDAVRTTALMDEIIRQCNERDK